MIVRLLILIALVLGTLPAPAAAAPPCHEAAGTMATPMPMDHDMPAPERDPAPVMGKPLCVGCIAPATMKTASVAAPHALVAAHAASAPTRAMAGALLTPEPPPPRG
ncbi:hypothetical protein [Sphingomonas sp. J315]|uniref:hypothetical protein n=1 Tax=Sphingomonas sp. J315 TaxID=2898433 RepID=UPI0021ADD46E|nr:hypothetical protein [Sphingomonas sp. J315]UUY00155.1 hypothetical protein LRS08_03215 [Sphingomonas sp. J315]